MPSRADMDRERSRERPGRKGQDIQKSEQKQVRRKPASAPLESTEPQALRPEVCPLDWQFTGVPY